MATEPARIDAKKLFGLALIPAFLLIILVLVVLNLPHTFEPPFLLGFLNTLFLGIIPIVIAYVAMKVYTRNGSVSVFLIGSGVLIFGLGSIVAGWVNPLPGGPNMTVTIHNSCALLSSIFILVGAMLSNSTWRKERRKGNTGIIAATYAGIFVFVAAFSLATFQGMIPPFFVPGSGPTALRQIVLENAVAFFAISSVLFMLAYRKRRSEFFFWYTVAMALVTIGLMAVFFQPSIGSLIGWVGRSAQYLGCVFLLYAVLIARKAAAAKGLPLEDVIGNFFVDAEQNYRQLVETATDAIVTIDEDYRVLLWNSAAERMFGYPRDDAIGASFLKLVIDDSYIAVIKNYEQDISGRDIPALTPEPVEIVGKHKDGALFPVEVTISRRWQEGRLIHTCILRDITERKRAEEELLKKNEELAEKGEELKMQFDALAESERITRLSEERLIMAQEIGRTGSWEYNVQTGKIWGSAEGSHIYGFPPVAGDFPLDDIEACIPERERVHQALTDLITTGKDYNIEYAINPADSSAQKIIHSIARLEKEEKGNPLKVVGVIQDITDIWQIKALRESEEKYRLAMDATSDGLWDWDVRTNRVYYSPAWLMILGEDSIPPVYGSWEKKIHPDDRVRVISSLREQLEGKTGTWQCEHRLSMNSGGWKWVLGRGQVVARNPEGSPLRLVGTMLDITERKKAEEALRESEKSYRGLFNTIRQAIYILNPDGTFVDVNEGAEAMYGFAREEFIGRTPEFLSAPGKNDLAAVMEYIKKAFAGEPQLFGFWGLRKGGEIFPKDVYLYKGTYFGKDVIVAVSADITERKRAEEALRESEEKFRTLFESMAPGVFYQRSDGILIDANHAALSMFGLTREQFMGRDSYDPRWKVVSESGELLPAEQHPSMIALRSGKMVRDLVIGVYNPKQDVMRWLSTNAEPQFRSGDATPYQVFVTMYDITERKKAEQTIRHALAEKEVLLREIHHRVKNNLAGILSLIELQISSLSDPVQIAPFKDLELRIRSMALVHDSLLRTKDLARINIASYTENLTRHLLPAYGTPGEVRCRIEMEDIILPIETATPCGLVMNEIVTNSLKYAFPKTFSCEKIRGEPCTISLTLHREGSDYLLGIADNGIGMPEGIDVTRSHTLGRFLIRLIVEHQLRGSLEMSTERGTAYTIRFPEPAAKERNTHEKM